MTSKGPKRALNALRWLNKLEHLGWQLDSIVLDPPASRRAAARSQGLVVEPPMLTHLERGIREAFARQDSRWTALLGNCRETPTLLKGHLRLQTKPFSSVSFRWYTATS